jgi:hypothetical protein
MASHLAEQARCLISHAPTAKRVGQRHWAWKHLRAQVGLAQDADWLRDVENMRLRQQR